MSKYCIGVDIGGTHIKAGLVNSAGKIIKEVEVDTQAFRDSNVVFENIVNAIEELFSKNTNSIGIGCPGPLDTRNGVIIETPNLPFRNFPLVSKLKRKFKVKNIVLENDANCFTLGEALYGKAEGHSIVFGIILGTGFGSSLVINNEIYHGARGIAPEIGHTTINYDNEKDPFKNKGAVETYISKESLLKFSHMFGFDIEDTAQLFDFANKSSKNIEPVMKMYGKYLGIALANIVYSYDPEIIVLGGGVSNLFPYFRDYMLEEMKERLTVKPPKIIKSSLQSKAAILGAASLVMKNS